MPGVYLLRWLLVVACGFAVFTPGAFAQSDSAPARHWTKLRCASVELGRMFTGAGSFLLCRTADERMFVVTQLLFNPTFPAQWIETLKPRFTFPRLKYATISVYDDGSILGSYIGGQIGFGVVIGAEYGMFKKVDFQNRKGLGQARVFAFSLLSLGALGGTGGFKIWPYPGLR